MTEPQHIKLSEVAHTTGIPPADILKIMVADDLLAGAVRGRGGHIYFREGETPRPGATASSCSVNNAIATCGVRRRRCAAWRPSWRPCAMTSTKPVNIPPETPWVST